MAIRCNETAHQLTPKPIRAELEAGERTPQAARGDCLGRGGDAGEWIERPNVHFTVQCGCGVNVEV